ncbi:MAG TPA: hypothetical protein DCY03_03880 [Planctomycetaceae bacterium]|nr:hypothetical protein [Planctomycetaceae bacterium]
MKSPAVVYDHNWSKTVANLCTESRKWPFLVTCLCLNASVTHGNVVNGKQYMKSVSDRFVEFQVIFMGNHSTVTTI